jgi:ribosome-associated protein
MGVEITTGVQIPDEELLWTFARSSGPGGQNVNKVASKAVLHWDARRSKALADDVRARLFSAVYNRMTTEGVLVIHSQRFRDQERNKEDCLEKLREWVLEALKPPRPRKKTRPSRASKRRRLQDKAHRASTKDGRRMPRDD